MAMPTVWLGNKASLDRDKSGAILAGNRITTIGNIHEEDDLDTRMRTIVHPDGLWPRVSSAPAAWVESDDPELAKALSVHFGCPIGRPDDWA